LEIDLRNTKINDLDVQLMSPIKENFKFTSRNNIYLKIEYELEKIVDISVNHLIKNKVIIKSNNSYCP
jgi:hypothetical protein